MSMLNRPANSDDLGEVIASTRDYDVAQKTVSKLIAGEVPARDIAIVGAGVRTVERVTGKLGYAAAARAGAMNGVLIGLLLWTIMLFSVPDAPLSLFIGYLLVGVALGMIMSLVSYSIVRRRRDFASMTQMLADHYEVRVQAASLAQARRVVGPERPAAVRPPVDLNEPPRYGERLPAPGQGPSQPDAPAQPQSSGQPHGSGQPQDSQPRQGDGASEAPTPSAGSATGSPFAGGVTASAPAPPPPGVVPPRPPQPGSDSGADAGAAGSTPSTSSEGDAPADPAAPPADGR